MWMRNCINCIIFFTLLSCSAMAQDEGIQNLPRFDLRRVHFGFTLGFNQMNFKVNKVAPENVVHDTLLSVVAEPQMGFQIGIISDLMLGKNFNVRFVPSLSFGDRTLIYEIYHPWMDSTITFRKNAESTFLDFPIFFKYKTNRIVNTRAYIFGGAKYSLDLASQAKKKQDNEQSLKLESNDLTLELGTGFEFYLEYFKFGIEIRMSYGMIDVLKHENNVFVQDISSLRTKMFWVSFTFE